MRMITIIIGFSLLAVVAVPLSVLLILAAGIWNGMDWMLQKLTKER